jgi:hypothetical protein
VFGKLFLIDVRVGPVGGVFGCANGDADKASLLYVANPFVVIL